MDILLAVLVVSNIFFLFYVSLLLSTLKDYRDTSFYISTTLKAYPFNDDSPSDLVDEIQSLLDKLC